MAGWDFMFLNTKYKDKIKIETYVISEEKVSNIFSKERATEKTLPLENYQELFGKKIYLVVCLRNEGNVGAWGSLLCTIDNKYTAKIYVSRVPFNEWDTYIIPIGTVTWDRSNAIPKVNIEWEKLYAK